jgi:hypothetical protein
MKDQDNSRAMVEMGMGMEMRSCIGGCWLFARHDCQERNHDHRTIFKMNIEMRYGMEYEKDLGGHLTISAIAVIQMHRRA